MLLNFSSPLNRNFGLVSEQANELYRIHVNRDIPQSTLNKTEPFDTDANEFFESRKVPDIRINDEASPSDLSVDSRLGVVNSPSDFSISSMPIDDLNTAISDHVRSTPIWTAAPPVDSGLLHPNWDQNFSGPVNWDGGNPSLFGGLKMSDESFNNQGLLENLHQKLNDFLEQIENPLAGYSPARDMTDFDELQEQRRRDMTERRFQLFQNIGSPGFDATLDGLQDSQVEDIDLGEVNPFLSLNDFLDNPIESPLEAYSPARDVADFATLQEQRLQDMGQHRYRHLYNIGSARFDTSKAADKD